MYFIDEGPLLPSVEHLIEYYCLRSDGLPCKLRLALSIGKNTFYYRHTTWHLWFYSLYSSKYTIFKNSKNSNLKIWGFHYYFVVFQTAKWQIQWKNLKCIKMVNQCLNTLTVWKIKIKKIIKQKKYSGYKSIRYLHSLFYAVHWESKHQYLDAIFFTERLISGKPDDAEYEPTVFPPKGPSLKLLSLRVSSQTLCTKYCS